MVEGFCEVEPLVERANGGGWGIVRLVKKVVCPQTGILYNDAKEAAAHIGCNPVRIREILCGSKTHYKGMVFRYHLDTPSKV